MDDELTVLNVSTNCWETEAINEWLDWSVGFVRLCKAFSTQYIKYCSVDWCSCINTSVNDAVSYIVAFSTIPKLSASFDLPNQHLQDSKNRVKVITFWSALLTAWRLLQQTMKVFPLNSLFIHITMLIYHYYLYKNERKLHHNTLKTFTLILFWIQWRQTTKVMDTEGGLLNKFQA